MLTKLTSKPDFLDYTSRRCDERCYEPGTATRTREGNDHYRRCVRPFEPEHEVHYFFVMVNTSEGEMEQWYAWTT